MTTLRILDARRAELVRSLCELIVPGAGRTGAEVYVDALLARMGEPDRDAALAAFDRLAQPAASGAEGLADHVLSPDFALVRSLACEAFYSDFVADGAPGPGAWLQIDFAPPLAARLDKDWSYLGVTP